MFTGIIESVGVITGLEQTDAVLNLTIRSAISAELRVDQSVAHNGVCLTVVAVSDDTHTVQLVQETLKRTSFKSITIGTQLNLERSIPAQGRFEGHVVQGHVDGVGQLMSINDEIYTFRYPQSYKKFLVEKGSVCVDGVSLTVAGLEDDLFSVAIIPHTLVNTGFRNIQPGTSVNLEFDIIAKHVARMLELRDLG